MSYNQKRLIKLSSIVLYTLITAALLCMVFLLSIRFVYTNAEEEGFEILHMQTKQIKEDIKLQILSDRENLSTIASFASNLYESGDDFSLIFDAFKSIGLIENVCILLPDNTFVTKSGKVDMSDKMSFAVEVERREYTSGRVEDIINPEVELVRNSVPIVSKGKIVGILYGIMELEALEERYENIVSELDAQLYVYEEGTGNFIIDTFHDTLGNISELKDFDYNDGYSYEQLVNSENGYSAFVSKTLNECLYIHYAELGISDWKIMLARPEKSVFKSAHYITLRLFFAFFIMVMIIFLYLVVVLRHEGRKSKIAVCASSVRKLLLDINQQPGNVVQSLKLITEFSGARSTLFVDTDGVEYNYIMPSLADKKISGEDRNFLISIMFDVFSKDYMTGGSTVSIVSIIANASLRQSRPELYEFLIKNNIDRVCCVAAADKNNRISILGTVNPERVSAVRRLLQDIAVCFSIAFYNLKHLNKTETIASTDSLTGLYNRVTYNRDIDMFNRLRPEKFACIYIDVNELHSHNNKFGHAAGDQMLIYIANAISEVFSGHKCYRMGGDEFLVFSKDTEQDKLSENINELFELLKQRDYYVAVGMAYRDVNTDTEELVKEAEVKMYDAKSRYYQNKELIAISSYDEVDFDYISTGNDAVNSLIKCLKENYFGICQVSFDKDKAKIIMMPKYLHFNVEDETFSEFLSKYINEYVTSDFRRAMTSFVNYDTLQKQLADGNIIKINYQKISGENAQLSVYAVDDSKDGHGDTLWVFSKV